MKYPLNNLVLQKNIVVFLIYFSCIVRAFAQNVSYPVGYFGFPILPGKQNFLSGGMGDLRTNHFHAGIDIKTQQREGLPVYAAAEGYVSRIVVMTEGYGNVIFIKHPTGFTTVYGHLLNFNDLIGKYVRQRQYERQSFEIELKPQPNELPVKKLEMIGLSGNTGGSGGPHLHFEIRDSKDNILNPVNFGFAEIQDDVPPGIDGLALKSLTMDGRINGEYGRKVFNLLYKKGEGYRTAEPITVNGTFGLELLCHDKTNGSANKNGVTCIEIEMDGKTVWNHSIEMFPNEWTRDYNVHINYEMEKLTGQRWNRCYWMDGNRMPFYQEMPTKGRITIKDDQVHNMLVKVWDAYQNLSFLTFQVVGSQTVMAEQPKINNFPLVVSTSVDENTLIVNAKNVKTTTPLAFAYFKQNKKELPIAYLKNSQAVFLCDLRKGLPDSVQVENQTQATYFRYAIPSGIKKKLAEANYSVDFEATSLFDTLYLNAKDNGNGLTLGTYTIPLRDYITVTYKPLNQPSDKTKAFMYLRNSARPRFLGGTWKGNEITFRTRELGNFVLLSDTTPPRARIATKNKDSFSAYISDDLSDIGSWKALVNGEWVLMNYDFKRDFIWSEKRDTSVAFNGNLTLEVKDEAGNTTILEADLDEPMVVPSKKKKSAPTKRPRATKQKVKRKKK